MPPPEAQPHMLAGQERAKSRDLRQLRHLWPFVRPYRWHITGAVVAATVAAAMVLALGRGIGALIDQGFGAANAALLDHALFIIIVGTIALSAATYARVWLVSWLGERVVANVRRKIYDHIIGVSPAFFEVTRTGEVLSRLTADTTLVQSLVGATASVALRNLLLFVGGIVMMLVTSPQLTGLAMLVLPLVMLPIILFGRRVRRLLSQSQVRRRVPRRRSRPRRLLAGACGLAYLSGARPERTCISSTAAPIKSRGSTATAQSLSCSTVSAARGSRWRFASPMDPSMPCR